MSRVHDMGGRLGSGPIPEIEMEDLFHADWEKRALALTLATGALGKWNIDASRHSRELLPSEDYARFTYFEKWTAAVTDLLVQTDCLTKDALREPPQTNAVLSDSALRSDAVAAAMSACNPYTRDSGPAPLFAVGDLVQTADKNPNPVKADGHTRLPGYAMGRVGKVVQLHGNHVLPDTNAHFKGENPEPLYAVEFDAQTLWGDTAEADGDSMVLDLWQSYLTAVKA